MCFLFGGLRFREQVRLTHDAARLANISVDIQQYSNADECLLIEPERYEFTLAGRLLSSLSNPSFTGPHGNFELKQLRS